MSLNTQEIQRVSQRADDLRHAARPQTPMAVPPPGKLVTTAGTMDVVSSLDAEGPRREIMFNGPGEYGGLLYHSPREIKFNGYGEYGGLLYHSPHTVLYQDELYPTALHLFEAHKFLDHRPDIADRIRLCEHVDEVTAISAELAEYMRRDWDTVALSTVSRSFILLFFMGVFFIDFVG
jgi:hypothetical protein